MHLPRPDQRKGRHARAATLAVVVVAVAVSLCVALVISLLMIEARDESHDAIELSRLRNSISEMILQQERVELGELDDPAAIEALSASVRTQFDAVEPNLRALDAGLAEAMGRSLDGYLEARDAWFAAFEQEGSETEGSENESTADEGATDQADADADDSAAEQIDSEQTDPAAEALIRALNAAMIDTERQADRTMQRGVLGIWIVTLLGGAVMTLITRFALRASRAAAAFQRDRLADERLRALVTYNDEVLLVYGPDCTEVMYVSPSIERVLGYRVADVIARPYPETFVDSEHVALWSDTLASVAAKVGSHQRVLVKVHHADGRLVHLEADVTNLVEEPSIGGVVVNARDISDRVNLQEDLAHQATHDALTGLANRMWFSQQVTATLQAGHDPAQISVLLVDLDGFKEINDSLGHGAGDDVLITVAARLATLTRQRDCVARLGGDEFALLLVGDDAHPLAARIVERLAEPIELAVGPVTIGGSVGVATADRTSTVVSLLRDADAAMYDAKARGKNRVSVFAPAMHDSLVERLRLRAELDATIATGGFALAYQPKLNLGDGQVEGFEALVRWPRPDGTVVAPNDFIPLAESTGQIVAIGAWVLRTALAQLASWQRSMPGGTDLTMAVNVSTRQLASADFVPLVRDVLVDSGVDPSTVTLEITETMLMEDMTDAARVLAELRGLGVRIAVDDYGSGHASIGYLRHLPVDVLKIDRSFVAALDSQPEQADAYLRSITELARSLRLDTVAEGIEHEHQLRHLRALGCDSGQGYHLARPLSSAAASEFLLSRSRLAA